MNKVKLKDLITIAKKYEVRIAGTGHLIIDEEIILKRATACFNLTGGAREVTLIRKYNDDFSYIEADGIKFMVPTGCIEFE